MKKAVVITAIAVFAAAIAAPAFAIDPGGVQAPAPYGVFSTITAYSPAEKLAAAGVSMDSAYDPDYLRFSGQLVYGVTNTVELGMTLPYINYQDEHDRGFEDPAFWVKHRFFEEGRYGPSVAYMLTASASAGDKTFGTGGSVGGGMVVSKRLGPFVGHVNLLYSHPWNSEFEDGLRGSAAVVFSAAHNAQVLAEFIEQKTYYSKTPDMSEMRFGLRFFYGEHVTSTLGAGFNVMERDPKVRFMAAISVLFPGAASRDNGK